MEVEQLVMSIVRERALMKERERRGEERGFIYDLVSTLVSMYTPLSHTSVLGERGVIVTMTPTNTSVASWGVSENAGYQVKWLRLIWMRSPPLASCDVGV